MNFDSKSILAKLMATENLIVEERTVSTAFFDVKNRILVVPTLDQKISSELYDLFMGHEVGHALYTPVDGMKKAKDDGENMSIINVVEDVRIEKKIKLKYPGLKNSFVVGYNDLIARNFFETEGKDLNEMNFIDRLNMHFKGGAVHAIKFNEKERKLVKEVENAETYEDVVVCARKIVEYMKLDTQENSDSDNSALFSSDDYDEVDEEYDELGDFNMHAGAESKIPTIFDQNLEEQNESSDNTKSKSTKKVAPKKKQSENPVDNEEIVSKTDEAYKKNESQLFADSNLKYTYLNIPFVETEKCIVDYKKLYKLYKESTFSEIDTKGFNELRKDSSKVVSYLAKEFELRKNAEQMKRTSISKTGELNMDRIYSYSFNEDLFKKMAVTPNGKSHGLVMFLDWSGSMLTHMGNTMKQLMNLVMFCKQVNVPYEVYAFLDSTTKEGLLYSQKLVHGDVFLGEFFLANILSSRMSTAEFTEACGALTYMAGDGRKRYVRTPNWFQLQGTPLNQTIVAAMEIVPEFQKRNRLNIVNAVFLTDGAGDTLGYKVDKTRTGDLIDATYDDSGRRIRKVIFRDMKTRNQELCDDWYSPCQTAALVKLLKKRANCNVVGFYIASANEFRSRLREFFPNKKNHEAIKEEFRKNNCMVVKSSGFDEYYVLRSNGLVLDEEQEFVVRENATTRGLVTAFSKFANGRIQNRVILNRFIGMIT